MRVLVIEGDKATARILESVLRDEDIGVDIAEDADEAVQFARHFDYDALVLDMHNSDIRGVEALRVIRRAESPYLLWRYRGPQMSMARSRPSARVPTTTWPSLSAMPNC